ncbi:hypothetical protein HYQ46_007045 [Verticillium longisporum]|nr:hypothetical protein HYQ46_007045 [Verticillium longisporum]
MERPDAVRSMEQAVWSPRAGSGVGDRASRMTKNERFCMGMTVASSPHYSSEKSDKTRVAEPAALESTASCQWGFCRFLKPGAWVTQQVSGHLRGMGVTTDGPGSSECHSWSCCH